ncbi:MAG: lysine--tRNA ligase [Coriobacteriales bacterium]|nr:lysine--tRNA ligase [Coriobacteriales bacterium]
MADEQLSQEAQDTAVVPEQAILDERSMRLAKRQAIIDAGGEAYGSSFEVSAHAADLSEKYRELDPGVATEDVVRMAGRIMAIRDQGKVCFFVLRDASGDIQLFCRTNSFEPEQWQFIKNLDMGDFIGIEGTVLRTRRGELSVSPSSIILLSKAIRPLPEKFHGLTDKETRYRRRYVDLAVNPEVKDVFMKRFKINAAIRRYMENLEFIEVETPMIHAVASGANAKPFITHYNALGVDCYLRIAPELHLKRLLVGGFERVYEMNRSFRNEGMDYKHNPEFTTLEAYQAYSDLQGMKELCEGLIKAANAVVNESELLEYEGKTIDISGSWPMRPMCELVSEVCGCEITMDTPLEVLRDVCKKQGIEPQDDWGAGKLIFELYDEKVEKTIVNPTFVIDYPVEVSPLAKKKSDDERLTHRFELVIGGAEYANAFSELNDPVDQEARFKAQAEAKAHGDAEAMDYDYDYVRALEYGMPPAGGIGIGIDRLVMLLCGQSSIRDVLLFPHMRPEADEA